MLKTLFLQIDDLVLVIWKAAIVRVVYGRELVLLFGFALLYLIDLLRFIVFIIVEAIGYITMNILLRIWNVTERIIIQTKELHVIWRLFCGV